MILLWFEDDDDSDADDDGNGRDGGGGNDAMSSSASCVGRYFLPLRHCMILLLSFLYQPDRLLVLFFLLRRHVLGIMFHLPSPNRRFLFLTHRIMRRHCCDPSYWRNKFQTCGCFRVLKIWVGTNFRHVRLLMQVQSCINGSMRTEDQGGYSSSTTTD